MKKYIGIVRMLFLPYQRINGSHSVGGSSVIMVVQESRLEPRSQKTEVLLNTEIKLYDKNNNFKF